ncbi:SPOR domain-containing protein [Rhizorhabdus histidinilytica]
MACACLRAGDDWRHAGRRVRRLCGAAALPGRRAQALPVAAACAQGRRKGRCRPFRPFPRGQGPDRDGGGESGPGVQGHAGGRRGGAPTISVLFVHASRPTAFRQQRPARDEARQRIHGIDDDVGNGRNLPARQAAQQKAADERSLAEDRRAAQRKAAAEKAAAEKKAKAQEEAKARKSNPERYWVQIASGAYKPDLDKEWDKQKKAHGKLLAGKTPWTTPYKTTNRLLIGPFPSKGAAQDYVNEARAAGLSSFPVTTSAGQKVERIN